MSELKRVTVTVKNYKSSEAGDLDQLYKRVRLVDEEGKTFYYSNVVVPKYLDRKGALKTDVPRTWFVKHLAKKSIVIIACEMQDGRVEYDLDDLRTIARSTVLKGIVLSLASIPMAIIVATATFGVGLLIIPMGVWYGYRNIFKVPSMLSRKILLEDLSRHGVTSS